MLTRKDYKAIAEAIDKSTVGVDNEGFEVVHKRTLVEKLSKVFADDNPNFDDLRFEDACYPIART